MCVIVNIKATCVCAGARLSDQSVPMQGRPESAGARLTMIYCVTVTPTRKSNTSEMGVELLEGTLSQETGMSSVVRMSTFWCVCFHGPSEPCNRVSITEFDGAVVQIDKHLLHAQRHMLSDPLALLHLLHVNLSAMHANGMACQQLCCILT